MFLRLFSRLLCLAPETGAGSGGGTGSPPPTAAEAGKTTGGETGEAPAPPPSGDGRTFTQADLDRIIKERLAEESQRHERRSAAEKKQAEEAALAKNAEWEKLAQTRGAELEGLKGKAEAADAYAAQLNGLIDSEIKAWPVEVTALDPGKDALQARLTWVANARALAAKLATLPKAPNTEGGAGNQPPRDDQRAEGGKPATRYRFQNPGDVEW